MPYIPPEQREELNARHPESAGELTYLICKLLDRYHGALGLDFGSIAGALAALTAAQQEYYRRIVAPYESRKAAENGDVFVETSPLLYAGPSLSQRAPRVVDERYAPDLTPDPDAAHEGTGEVRGVDAEEAAAIERRWQPGDPTGNLSGNPNIKVGVQDGKEVDDGLLPKPGQDPNST